MDLKHLNNEITMLDYTNQFNFALSRSWPLFWIFLSVVTLIKSLLGVMGISLGGKSFDGDGFDVIFEWINNMLAPLAVFQSIFYASNLWLTIPGTIGFVLLSTYVVRNSSQKNEPHRPHRNRLPWCDLTDGTAFRRIHGSLCQLESSGLNCSQK
ncbi:MAG: hypothetical protein IPL73_25625 [Candidatus Obscuribacter sp.]|nr:hypothetical protein [Candidatus Obscuribacter sp.]